MRKKKIWKIIGGLFLFFMVVGILGGDTDSQTEEKSQQASVETGREPEQEEKTEKKAEDSDNKEKKSDKEEKDSEEKAEKKEKDSDDKAEKLKKDAEGQKDAVKTKQQKDPAEGYIFPDSDSRYLSEEEVRDIDAGKLRIARNELFARHGYIFQDEGLRQYFESQPWYSGTVEAEQFDFDTYLNDFEKANADLIRLVEEGGGDTETAATESNGQEQAAEGADAPYYSTEYLAYYLEEHHMEVNTFRETEKVVDFILSNHGEPVFVKKDGGFLAKPYYAMTKDNTDFFYIGQMKENKPDGMGAIFKPVNVSVNAESIGESDTARISESSSWANQYYLAVMYAGYFKEGRPEGFGMEFSVPGDEDYFIAEIPISGCQSEADIQGAFLDMANPIRYEGEFKEGEYSGRGNEYGYMETYIYGDAGRDTFSDEEDWIEALDGDEETGAKAYEIMSGTNKDITVYTGTYEKGERNGEFKIYELGCLAYEGDMRKGEYHGVGTEYYPMSEQVFYEGGWKNGDYHGTGTMYLKDGEIKYSGEWEYGDYGN